MVILGLFGRTYLERRKERGGESFRQLMGETLGINGLVLFRRVCDVVYTTATNRTTSEQLSPEIRVNSSLKLFLNIYGVSVCRRCFLLAAKKDAKQTVVCAETIWLPPHTQDARRAG